MAHCHLSCGGVPLKVVFLTHAFLFGLYNLAPFCGAMFNFSNIALLLLVAWVLIDARSALASELAFVWVIMSVVLDIIALGVSGHYVTCANCAKAQFAMAMAILNVLLKFYTAALLWFAHGEREGEWGCDAESVSHRHHYESVPEPKHGVSVSVVASSHQDQQ